MLKKKKKPAGADVRPTAHPTTKVYYLAEEGTRTRQDQQGWQVTEKVVHDLWPTEMEMEYGSDLDQSREESTGTCCKGHHHTECGGYDGGVEQRVGDGSIPVVCHGCQETALSASHPNEEEKLSSTTHKGDGLQVLKKSQSILGATEEVYEISTKDKLPTKKSMGEWSCGSILIRTIRPRFQASVMK